MLPDLVHSTIFYHPRRFFFLFRLSRTMPLIRIHHRGIGVALITYYLPISRRLGTPILNDVPLYTPCRVCSRRCGTFSSTCVFKGCSTFPLDGGQPKRDVVYARLSLRGLIRRRVIWPLFRPILQTRLTTTEFCVRVVCGSSSRAKL